MPGPILEVKNLTKAFNKFRAVDNVSFEIGKGEILGLLGPNGAGKTTTIMMLLGIITPTSGQIKVFGLDLQPHRQEISQKINFSSAYTSFPGRLTVYENLYVFSCLYGLKNPRKKIEKLLEGFELSHIKNELATDLSSGEATRLGLCKSLLNDPELLFLDEPTASLDPDIAKKVRELLFTIRRERNISILYTSHNMDEVTLMCDRVIFLNQGRVVASDTPLNLTKMIKDCFLNIAFDAPLEKVKEFGIKHGLNFQIPHPNILEIILSEDKIGKTLTQLTRYGIGVIDISIERPDLEDVFIEIAKNKNERHKN